MAMRWGKKTKYTVAVEGWVVYTLCVTIAQLWGHVWDLEYREAGGGHGSELEITLEQDRRHPHVFFARCLQGRLVVVGGQACGVELIEDRYEKVSICEQWTKRQSRAYERCSRGSERSVGDRARIGDCPSNPTLPLRRS